MVKFKQKYLSNSSVIKIKRKQRQMQQKQFEKKGRKAKAVHFYEALDELLKNE